MITTETLMSILEERAKQDAQWGGEEHDDTHWPSDWLGFIQKQIKKASWHSIGSPPFEPGAYRACMVKIAALAAAAIDAHDRLYGVPEADHASAHQSPYRVVLSEEVRTPQR